MSENTVPRRNRLDLNTKHELMIVNVVNEVEKMPADPRLTNVITKLTEAKSFLSDYIDDIQPAQNLTQKLLTSGEKRVGKTFNPSNSPTVEKLKDLGAEMIDVLESLRGDINSQGKSGEGQRTISTAQTLIEGATMWAVKSVFVE